MEGLKNQVKETTTKGKYCYIKTDKSIDEIKKIFETRTLLEIGEKQECIFIKFKDAITKGQLNKQFQENILFTSFIKNNSNIKTDSDTWFVKSVKKVFETNDMDYDDLERFETSDLFFNKYNPVLLEKKVIALINNIYIQRYRAQKKQEVLKYIDEGGLRLFQTTIYNIIKGKPNNRLIYSLCEPKEM